MKKIVLIFSLIALFIGIYNQNYNPFPQFTDEENEFICREEYICLK